MGKRLSVEQQKQLDRSFDALKLQLDEGAVSYGSAIHGLQRLAKPSGDVPYRSAVSTSSNPEKAPFWLRFRPWILWSVFLLVVIFIWVAFNGVSSKQTPEPRVCHICEGSY